MRRKEDDDLNLEGLFTRCKAFDPNIMIRIYFDPDNCFFYIHFVDEMAFFLPPEASFICECRADGVRFAIELYIANAVRHWIRSPE